MEAVLSHTIVGSTNGLSLETLTTPSTCPKASLTLRVDCPSAILREVTITHSGVGVSHAELRAGTAVLCPRQQVVSMYHHKLRKHQDTTHSEQAVLLLPQGTVVKDIVVVLFNVWEPMCVLSVRRVELRGTPLDQPLSSTKGVPLPDPITVPTALPATMLSTIIETKVTSHPTDGGTALEAKKAPVEVKKERQEETAPLMDMTRILKGVGIVLSGFENPLRAELKKKSIALGAVVLPDWDPAKGSTHLICAYLNTPKYHSVTKSGVGVVVRKEWLLNSYDRKAHLREVDYPLVDTDAPAAKKLKPS